jgi:hypothetical protein
MDSQSFQPHLNLMNFNSKPMKRFISAALLILLPVLLTAQFQGQITYRLAKNGEISEDKVNLLFRDASLRVLADDVKVPGNYSMGMSTSDVVVHFDRRQMMVFSEADRQAIIVDIDAFASMVNGFKALAGSTATDNTPAKPKAKFTKTGRRESISGYDASEFKVESPDLDNEVFVWVNDNLKYDWNPAIQMINSIAGEGFGGEEMSAWMAQNYLPLRIEMKETNGDVNLIEVEQIVTKRLPESSFLAPTGYATVTFQEYFQQMMMKSMMGDGK